MRLRTPFASVWVDDSTDTLSSASFSCQPSLEQVSAPAPSTKAVVPPPQIQWATRAYTGKLGRYVAVKLRQGTLLVAIAETGVPLKWVRADSALTETQAREWLRTGFNR